MTLIASEARREWSSQTRFSKDENEMVLTSTLERQQAIVFADDILADNDRTLRNQLFFTPSLIVTTPTVQKLYGDAILKKIAQDCLGTSCKFLVLESVEKTKSIEQALKVCEAALSMNLKRRGQIVGFGGGVCLDIAGLAAAIYRRGVTHVKIPTTLIGQIDAGIGIKNGINFCGKKSVVGTFYPPALTLLDATFLSSLNIVHIRDGLSEAFKIALISDKYLFELIEVNSNVFFEKKLSDQAGRLLIRRSVEGMLRELSQNLYELDGYERKVDFGHTFSPYIESVSGYHITHGQAVAIDMAISSVLAFRLELINQQILGRILRLIQALGLPLYAPCISSSGLHASLSGIVAHRNGALNLVVPAGIGISKFITDLAEIKLSDIDQSLNFLRSPRC